MSAINVAANPLNAVISPSTSGTGSSAANSGEGSFATVLAEKTGKAPKAADKAPEAAAPAEETSAADEPQDGSEPATAVTVAPDTQGLTPPMAITIATALVDGVEDQGNLEQQSQTAEELIQAILTPAVTTPSLAQQVSAGIRPANSNATLATTALEATLAPVTEAGVRADPRGESVADMRVALARNAHGETSPDTGGAPAKLAAPQEVFALPTETRGMAATDFLATKSEAGLAQAAASLAAAAPMHTAAAQGNHGGEYRIATPPGSRHWETAIGNSLVIMTGSRQDRAELVLTPPQLGRIEVSISMKGDEASAVFVSANPAVRDAIENALPRLREVLADAGITLGQTQVGAESQGQWASERQNGDNASRRGNTDTAGDNLSQSDGVGRSSTAHRLVSRSLVDTYA